MKKNPYNDMKVYCFHSAESSDGRITIAAFIQNEKLVFGTARCNPKDNFIRKAGFKIAMERAINRPEFTMDIKPEKSVATQFVNRCLQVISEPISYNFERGSTKYIVKEKKKKEEAKPEAKVIPLRGVHDWDGDAIIEEERNDVVPVGSII